MDLSGITNSDREQVAAQAAAFGHCPADMRDWAEGLGYLALKARIDSGAAIAAQASSTLNLMLAGLAGTLAVGVRVLEPNAPALAWGAAAVAGYLALLALAMVHWCINLRDAPALYNRPGNLLVPGATLEQVRLGGMRVPLSVESQIKAIGKQRHEASLTGLSFGVPCFLSLGAC